MKNTQKGFLPVLVIILVVVGIFGGLAYLGIKHPSKTSTTKETETATAPTESLPGVVYENKEAGISYTFPPGWVKVFEDWEPNTDKPRGVPLIGGVVFIYPLYGKGTTVDTLDFKNPRIAISNSSHSAGPGLEASIKETILYIDKNAKITPITLNGDKGFDSDYIDRLLYDKPAHQRYIITGHYDIFISTLESDWNKFEKQINTSVESYKVVLRK
jgi:hypothetical protein